MKVRRLFTIFFVFLFFLPCFVWGEVNVLQEVLFLQKPGDTLIFNLKHLPEYEINQKGDLLTIKFKNTLPGSNSKWIGQLPKTIFKKVSVALKGQDLLISLKLAQPFNFKASIFETSLIVDLFYPSTKIPKHIKIVGKKVEKSYTYPSYQVPQLGKGNVQIPFTKKYKGQPISVDFQNADIHAVLRMLAEVGGFNLVVSDKVKGTITLKLNKVPWDEVLDIVLVNNGLGMVKVGNVVRIAPISQLKAESEQYQAYLESLKKIKEEGVLVTKVFQLKYVKAEEVINQVKAIIGQKGTVTADTLSNSLIVKASQGIIDEIKNLLKKIDKPNKQILIEARIIEIEDSYAHSLGIKWGGVFWKTGDHTIFGVSPNPSASPGTITYTAPNGGVPSVDVDVNTPVDTIVDLGVASSTTLGFVIGRIGKTTTLLDMQLSALESKGVARIISAPRILTLDNQEAEIKQGKKIPYLKLNEQGVATTEFIDAVIRLKVTPHITADNRINLDIEVEKNTPDFSTMVNGVPAVITRYAKTKVLINSGDTLVIGGIKINDISESTGQVPGISKLPGIGSLFKSKERNSSKTELMIFITPRIVSVEIPGVDY